MVTAGEALYLDSTVLDGERGYFCPDNTKLGGVALFSATLYSSGLQYQFTPHRNAEALWATPLPASLDRAQRILFFFLIRHPICALGGSVVAKW
jgi:hypothetical protein